MPETWTSFFLRCQCNMLQQSSEVCCEADAFLEVLAVAHTARAPSVFSECMCVCEISMHQLTLMINIHTRVHIYLFAGLLNFISPCCGIPALVNVFPLLRLLLRDVESMCCPWWVQVMIATNNKGQQYFEAESPDEGFWVFQSHTVILIIEWLLLFQHVSTQHLWILLYEPPTRRSQMKGGCNRVLFEKCWEGWGCQSWDFFGASKRLLCFAYQDFMCKLAHRQFKILLYSLRSREVKDS